MTNETDGKPASAQYAYAYLLASGVDVVGKPTGPFVMFDERRDVLVVFGATFDNVECISFPPPAAGAPATFQAGMVVDRNVVLCECKKYSASGATYKQAAMRALVAHLG